MKKLLLIMIIFSACKKEAAKNQPPPPGNNQPASHPAGSAIFYLVMYPSPYYGNGVDVWVNWQSAMSPGTQLSKISSVPQNTPNCGDWMGDTYANHDTIPYTTLHYTYHAVLDGIPAKTWNGAFDLDADTCVQIGLSNQ